MIARLGHVLGWIGDAVAALIVVGTAIAATKDLWDRSHDPYAEFSTRVDSPWDTIITAVFPVVGALFIFLAGRAARYVLSGPK
jgi:hypothetical protein